MELNVLRDRALEIAKKNGWNNRSYKHYICLVVSELMEAVESYRNLKVANKDSYIDRIDKTKLVSSMERFCDDNFYNGILIGAFQTFIKDTVEDELADTFIRLLHLAGLYGINLDELNIEPSYCVEDYDTFTEWVFTICENIFENYKVNVTVIRNTMSSIMGYCNYHNIDLEFHIKEKMRYNEISNYIKINEICSLNHGD